MKTGVPLLGIVFLIIVVIIISTIHQSEAASSSKPVKFKIVFINSLNDECTQRNYKALDFYDQVTRKYLSLYSMKYSA
ncbi:MAG: hypothetical protein ACRD9Q_07255, partial [Nitrososphaeraceae archaeon]